MSKRFMDKTQKERILHALQRLEQNVGKVGKADGDIHTIFLAT